MTHSDVHSHHLVWEPWPTLRFVLHPASKMSFRSYRRQVEAQVVLSGPDRELTQDVFASGHLRLEPRGGDESTF